MNSVKYCQMSEWVVIRFRLKESFLGVKLVVEATSLLRRRTSAPAVKAPSFPGTNLKSAGGHSSAGVAAAATNNKVASVLYQCFCSTESDSVTLDANTSSLVSGHPERVFQLFGSSLPATTDD